MRRIRPTDRASDSTDPGKRIPPGPHEKTLASEAPMLINAEGGLVHRAMRDMFDKEIEEVLVQGDEAYREAKDLAKLIMPSQAKTQMKAVSRITPRTSRRSSGKTWK